MDKRTLANLSAKIAETLVDNRHVIFFSELDKKEFRDCVIQQNKKYVYISVADVKENENLLSIIASEITNIVNSDAYADDIREIRRSSYKTESSSTSQARDFLHLAFRILNDIGFYVVHLHPINIVFEHDNFIDFLEGLEQNEQYPNLRFTIMCNNSEKKQIKNNALFTIKNLDASFKEVLISYKSLSNNEVLCRLKSELTSRSINYVLDKDDSDYLANIPEFEERVGRGGNFIAIVSKPYLSSIQCMYEIAYMFKIGKVREQLILISLGDFSYNEIIADWSRKKKEIDERIAMIEKTECALIFKEQEYVTLILDYIEKIWTFLKSTNTLTLADFWKNGIEKVISLLGSTSVEPSINKSIDLIKTGTTMANITIVQNGANSQINVNSENGVMTVTNNCSTNNSLLEKEIEDYLKENGLLNTNTVGHVNALDYVYGEAIIICNIFKKMVEINQMSNIFYRKNRDPDETDWQLLLYTIAVVYQKGSNGNYSVAREENPGNGEIDMVFSQGNEAIVCLEMKRSSNNFISHGYTTQLPAYMSAKNANRGIFIIVQEDDKNRTQIEEVLSLYSQSVRDGKHAPEVIVVNGSKQVSASNPSYIAPK